MLKSAPDPSRVILRGLLGSHAYGTSTPKSDRDYKGVWVESDLEFTGLYEYHVKQQSYSETSPTEDSSYTELSQFCRLALNSPNIHELLWLPEEAWEQPGAVRSWSGKRLIDIRASFLSADHVFNAYVAYSKRQLRLMIRHEDPEDERREKHAKHIWRLMQGGYELYTTGVLTLKVDDPEAYHVFGRTCAYDTMNTIIQTYVKDFQAKFEQAKDNGDCALPARPDYTRIRDTIYDIRQWMCNPDYDCRKFGYC